MGIFSRTLQKYNLLKDFRVRNGVVFDHSDTLIFWLRASETLDSFVDRSTGLATINSIGSGFLNTRQGPQARFELKALGFDNKYQRISAGQAAGSGSTSLLFAGWIYLDVDAGQNNEGFCILQTDANEGFCIFVDDQGRLGIRLTNYSSSATLASSTVKTSNTVIPPQRWVHFAIALNDDIINETVFRTAATRPKIMIDGTLKATTATQVGDPSGLDPKAASASYAIGFGPAKDETNAQVNLDGALCDLALFQPNGDITESEMRALYEASLNGANNLGSGLMSTTPFNVLNDAMHRDTHPTVARHSNDGRQGNHKIFFDDTKAINLTNDGPTSFPTMLTEDHHLFSTVYNGLRHGELTTTAASASFSIFDEYYEESNSIAITPFVESKVYIESGSDFYQTGSRESLLPGLNQSLKNKEVITIEFTNESEVSLGAPGDISGAGGTDLDQIAYMAFWNNSSKSFVQRGHDTVVNNFFGSDAEKAEASQKNLTGSCVGFTIPRQIISSSGNYADDSNDFSGVTLDLYPDKFYSSLGNPIDTFGFPDDDRYNSNENETILMSDYINEPFLVEKIVFDFSKLSIQPYGNSQSGNLYTSNAFVMGQQTDYQSSFGHPVSYWPVKIGSGYELLTCFLLREFAGKTEAFNTTLHKAYPLSTITLTSSFSSNQGRDLLTYGQGLFYTGFGTSAGNTTLDRFSFINGNESIFGATSSNPGLSDFNNRTGYTDLNDLIQQKFPFELKINVGTGSTTAIKRVEPQDVRIETTPKIINKNTYAGSHVSRAGGFFGATLFKWDGQSSNQSFIANSRNFANSMAGKSNSEKALTLVRGGNPGTHAEITLSDVSNQDSPQILLPEDKIIFGVQSDFRANSIMSDVNGITFPAGINIKISLYGSYIREEKRITNSFNQLLGTHTVHESIGSENVLDSFNVEYMTSFTGSYSDNVMSGSSDPATIYEGHDFVTRENIQLARRVGGQASQGTQGETGAFKINNRLVDTNERDYDSLMPDFRQIILVDDVLFGETQSAALANNTLSFGTATIASASHWLYSFPFESRYANINRTHAIVKPDRTRDATYKLEFRDTTAGTSIFNFSDAGTVLTGSVGFAPRNSEFALENSNLGSTNQEISEKDMIRLLFGIGDLSRGRYYAIGADDDGNRTGVNKQNSGGTINLGGFKYGVSNSSPAYSSAVFRRSSFGQFRDLLEPRQFLTYIQDSKVNFPVSQKFVTRTGQPLGVTGRSNSTCSNLSTHATSSLPFFDRSNDSAPKNRDSGTTSVSPINISPNFAPALGPFTGLA